MRLLLLRLTVVSSQESAVEVPAVGSDVVTLQADGGAAKAIVRLDKFHLTQEPIGVILHVVHGDDSGGRDGGGDQTVGRVVVQQSLVRRVLGA